MHILATTATAAAADSAATTPSPLPPSAHVTAPPSLQSMVGCCVVYRPLPDASSSILVIPVFRNYFFGRKKTFLPGFLRIPFFPVFSGGIFHRNLVLERSQEFLFFFRCHRNISQEFLWDRNSCIYPGIIQITEDSGGFRRIPEDSCSRQKLLALASE
jgi:hypothetical protein